MRFTSVTSKAINPGALKTGAISLFVSGLWFAAAASGTAQLIPDNTLGTERSQPTDTTINGGAAIQIEGGARRARHLFHSFQEFNVSTGQLVYFANPVGVQAILTRVTGGNPSGILGTLGVQGTADLFLINPRGILFGPNAQLDLRGSFVASTADGVQFSDGFEFAATNPQAPPLLSVNIPVGLRFRDRPGAIVNQSVTQQAVLGFPAIGLAVNPEQSIALLGGDLRFDNGTITALQGTVQLGSVARAGTVGLAFTPAGLTVDYGNSRNGSITLSGTASVNVVGAGGGAIAVHGGQVTLRDRANLASDTIGDIDGRGITIDAVRFRLRDRAFVGAATIGAGAGGDVTIRATESINLQGISFENFQQTLIEPVLAGTVPNLLNREGVISTGTLGLGRAGDITLITGRLTLQQGAVILSPTLSSGAGGNISIRARNSMDVSASGILTTAIDQGNAGTLTLNTNRLTIRDESLVSTATFGAGNGGNLTVNATDSVRLSEFLEFSQFGNSLSTSTVGGTGNAGTLAVNTRSLLVEGGATITSASGAAAIDRLIPSSGRGGDLIINASDSITIRGSSRGRQPSRSQIVTAALGSGASGDLRVTTRRLVIEDGGAIGGSTVSSGRGGDIEINAAQSVEITGTEGNGLFSTGIATASGDPLIATRFSINPTGDTGNINLTTARLSLQSGATINAESVGIGDAGMINLVADAIALDNESRISSDTGSGAGGNINLRSQVLQLQDGSRISSGAGRSAGGNIDINSQFLVAFPTQNSDITANARTERGGRVTVDAPYIFGIAQLTRDQLRSQLGLSEARFAALRDNPANLLTSNDITAISQTAPNLPGAVVFSTAGINPAQSLVELPQTVVDPNTLIAANPCTQTQGSEFIITGRGGLPFNPNDVLSSQAVSYPWIEPGSEGVGELGSEGVGESGSGSAAIARQGEVTIARQEEVPAVQPAQGWQIRGDEVVLVAQSPDLNDLPDLNDSSVRNSEMMGGERCLRLLRG